MGMDSSTMSVSPPKDRGLGLLGSGTGGSSSHPTIAAPRDLDDRVGMEIGKYVVTRRLGRGGMGIVYEAEDTSLRRKVAIKFFSEAVAVTDDAVKRLVQEAQAAARLNHPNVVSVYEVGQHQGIYFLVMELVRGTSAEEHLKLNGPFDWVEATRVTAAACRALAAAHAAQLIHRDIKPANLLLCGDPVASDSSQGWHVKLGDFGLAKLVDSRSMATAADRVLGTPNYMSPEQCRSEALDPRTDLYSLGATYYSLLTGKPPFTRDQSVQVMFAHCWSPVPDPRETDPAIPESCAQIVKRAMAKDPHDRYRTALEMLANLDAALLEAPSRLAAGNSRVTQMPQSINGRGVEGAGGRDSPPFSRPLGPDLSKSQTARADPGNATLAYPVVGGPVRRKRRGRLIAASLLLAGIATAGGVVGWGRNHKPANVLGVPATAPANIPGRPQSLTEFRWSNDAGGTPASVIFSPDGLRVVAAVSSDAGGVRGWETATGRSNLTLLQGSPVSAITFPFSPDASELFVGKGGSIVRLPLMQGSARTDAPHVKGEIESLAWGSSTTGKHVLAVELKARPDGTQARLMIFNDKVQEMEFDPRVPEVLSVCFLGPTGLMATYSVDSKIRLWSVNGLDLSHGYPLWSSFDTDLPVYALASSASGRTLAAEHADSVEFFQIKDGAYLPTPAQSISKVSRPNHPCRSLALSPDGMTAAVGSGADSAGDVTLYDVNAGEMIAQLAGFGGSVNSLAFSPDGSLLATGCVDHTVKTWDLQKLLPGRAAPTPPTRPAQVSP
jgi:serine/threonine protein kinase